VDVTLAAEARAAVVVAVVTQDPGADPGLQRDADPAAAAAGGDPGPALVPDPAVTVATEVDDVVVDVMAAEGRGPLLEGVIKAAEKPPRNPRSWASSTSVSAPERKLCKMFLVVMGTSRR